MSISTSSETAGIGQAIPVIVLRIAASDTCLSGCGLYCYEIAGDKWVKLT